MSDELQSLIESTLSELNPTAEAQDNQVTEEDTTEVTEEVDEQSTDEVTEDSTEDSDTDVEETTNEEEDNSPDSTEKFSVKVDGQVYKVTLDELKSGYQRQADYTREKQALKADYAELEEFQKTYSQQFEAIQDLDNAWEENPITVISHFTMSTENPTQALALLIRDLAANNALDREFLDMFGITPEIQNQWKNDNQVSFSQTQSQRVAEEKEEALLRAQSELEVQKAISEYDKQLDDIIESEDYNFTTKQRADFRKQLARYAAENDFTNLKSAFKAFKYDEGKSKQKLANKTVEKAKQKKANNVVTRSGGSEGASVNSSVDLQSVIEQAMREASGN